MRILIADQDPEIRTLVATRLSARHYEVIETADSQEVLRALERQAIDLVLLSTDMERIDGRHLIEKIRQRSHYMTIPIILMTEENQIAELVMSQDRGFDDFLIKPFNLKPFNPLALQLRVAMNINRSRQRVEANALTHLPGNASIERVIREKIESKEKFSVLYMDVNNFKSFNDRYGFEKGDDVIRQTANILLQTAEAIVPEGECFVGHIGGDDFIVVLDPNYEEPYARKFIAEFDRLIPTYYNEADQKRGSIRVKNRQGKTANFPLMSCSVAACNNLHKNYKSLGEIAHDAAEVKSFLKTQPGSHYLRDRRSAPVHELQEAMEILAPEIVEKKDETDMDPLGQVLINAGLISHEQLSIALKKHLETGQRLGQVLISMNAIKSEDVGKMLEKKLNVPYVSLRKFTPTRDTLRLFTMDFIKAHRVVPIETVGDTIRLGMCDPFDLKTIDSIERITAKKPIPCLALEDEFEEFLDRYAQQTARE
jgi:diguanylate cyclase (GGDEF)-like protein